MSVLWRVLSLAALGLSAGILVFSIVSVRKEQRVRPGFDLLRLAITLATTVLMARFLGVTTPEAMMGVGFLGGLLLGVYEGLHLRVRFFGRGTFARRSALGVAAWGVGVVVVQAAGVIGRAGVADFGLTLSFLGIGQVVGLMTGRWETVLRVRQAGAAAGRAGLGLALLVLSLAGILGAAPGAFAQDDGGVDLRTVMAGEVPGVAVEVRGSGVSYYGPSLRLHFTNEARGQVLVSVPLGLQFLPVDEGVQTMIAAGAETITVPETGPDQAYTTEIMAFCGEHDDAAPSPEDVFGAGTVVGGNLAALVGLIHESGTFGFDEQMAVWHFTDGTGVSDSEVATALVVAAGGEAGEATGTAGEGEEAAPCACGDFTAGEGTRASMLGLGGSILLLLSALFESGHSFASVAAAWKGGRLQGLRELASGAAGEPAPQWHAVRSELGQGRAAAALEDLPSDLRERALETLAGRLEAEQAGTIAAAVRRALGALDLGADPGRTLAAAPKAATLLEGLPAEVRAQVEEQVVAGLQEERLAQVTESAMQALRRDRAVALLQEAIARRDGPAAGDILAAVGGEAESLWKEAAGNLDLKAADLDFPPPAPGGLEPPAGERLDLMAALDQQADLSGVVSGGAKVQATLAVLPDEVRREAEHRLVARLEAERLSRWVGKLRAGASAPGPTGGLLLRAEAKRLLQGLPPGLSQRLGEQAVRLLEEEVVGQVAAQARRVVVEDRAIALLRSAFGLGDGDRVDAIMDAVNAALDSVDEADLERLARLATGGSLADLAGLARTGAPPSVDLAADFAGATDLVAAARQVEGVEELLGRAGPELRARVEEALTGALNAMRVGSVVTRAAEALGGAGRAVQDVVDAVRALPEARDLFRGLADEAQQEAYGLLADRLDADRLEAAVTAVARALTRDRAEEALRRAAEAGDLAAGDRILAGLPAADAAEVAQAAPRAG